MEPELEALQEKHLKWLEDCRKEGKPVPQALAAYIDGAVPNLSSIVVLAEVADRCMLLTGDATGDKILEGLQLTGRLGPGQTSTMQVDVMKVPHHGSANNLAKDFFVGELYFSAGDYANASAALQKAVTKGGLSDADGTEMLLGIALKRKGDKAGAQKAFDAVKDPKFAEIAKLWKIAAR